MIKIIKTALLYIGYFIILQKVLKLAVDLLESHEINKEPTTKETQDNG